MSNGSGNQRPRVKSPTYPSGDKVRRFAWFPRKLSNGSWVWLKFYYVRFPYVIDPDATAKARRRFF
ncbi:hypothetical protein [Novosphingobium cyanobacteriorum]|uniref:Integrase n=1 Tax=Novosphingobium cyanobacteriorum TaxID=3024215 RepID=A0ABT6CM86_9SPHN|nr:hypothetical protein [Novosphingobium cyanobacteriorum]MDF8334977.1 hypothetical protein [Novosphingobium cyanobacteriorum]